MLRVFWRVESDRMASVAIVLQCVLTLALASQANKEGELINTGTPVPLREIDEWQTGPYCGVNCLFFLLSLNDRPVSYRSLRSEVQVTGEGASLLELKEAAAVHGLSMEVVELTPKEIARAKLPLIALMESSGFMASPDDKLPRVGHYVVLLRVDAPDGGEARMTLMDGSTARVVEVGASRVNRAFSGYALVPSSSDRSGPGVYLQLILSTVCSLEILFLFACLVQYARMRKVMNFGRDSS
jgi:Peptidase C39 family